MTARVLEPGPRVDAGPVTQDLVPEATVSSSRANKERTNPSALFLEPV